MLNFLIRTNYLQHFIFTLKEEDVLLQATLEPSPDSLNALYVFEAKMDLFLRISQTKDGAESLLSGGLLDIIADFRFIDSRPDNDSSMGMSINLFLLLSLLFVCFFLPLLASWNPPHYFFVSLFVRLFFLNR